MLKNTLLLSTLLIFTSCAERGYTLTTNTTTHTVTAETITSIKKESPKPKPDILKKMTKAVKKVLKTKVKTNTKSVKKKIHLKKKETILVLHPAPKKIVLPSKEKEVPVSEPIIKNNSYINSDEENRLKEEALQSKKLREAKLLEVKKLKESLQNKEKNRPLIHASKETKTENKLVKTTETKNIIQENLIKKQKELAAQKALAEEKIRKLKILQEKREKDRQVRTAIPKTKSSLATTKPLVFNQINKVYHKFGTSEVHGHVIYLTPNGQETKLSQTKVYLLPVSAKLNHWYNNYYLKNKDSGGKAVVNYLNKTALNLERNFEFFGVPEGKYYVIIESNYPSSIAKNKKVYIAKKIQVGKYKKIMGVFSKKL